MGDAGIFQRLVASHSLSLHRSLFAVSDSMAIATACQNSQEPLRTSPYTVAVAFSDLRVALYYAAIYVLDLCLYGRGRVGTTLVGLVQRCYYRPEPEPWEWAKRYISDAVLSWLIKKWRWLKPVLPAILLGIWVMIGWWYADPSTTYPQTETYISGS
jgi:hypothetical protein